MEKIDRTIADELGIASNMSRQTGKGEPYMSIESAKAFLERVKNDEDFRKSIGEIATAEERMNYVKEAGFDFTKEEIAVLKAELTVEELDGVAGGDGIPFDECERSDYQAWGKE